MPFANILRRTNIVQNLYSSRHQRLLNGVLASATDRGVVNVLRGCQLWWEYAAAILTFCVVVDRFAFRLTPSLQPWSPPSFVVPYLVSAFLLNPLGSASLTLVADYLRRVPGDARFFWRHWWHFPFLAGATWMVTWYLNWGYPFESSPGNPLLILLAVFTTVHVEWLLLTKYAAQRKRRERQTSKLDQSSASL